MTTFNLDEYVGLVVGSSAELSPFMQAEPVRPHQHSTRTATNVPDGRALDFELHCRQYEQRIHGRRRHRPADSRHRQRRAHRVQRARLVARQPHAAEDAGQRDDSRQRPLLRRRGQGAAAGGDDGRGHDPRIAALPAAGLRRSTRRRRSATPSKGRSPPRSPPRPCSFTAK